MLQARVGAAALALLAACASATYPDGAGDAPRFVPLHSRSLSGPLVWAADVRWTGDDELALTLVRQGVVTLSAGLEEDPEPLVAAGTWTGPKDLGVSERFLAAGISFGPVGWMDRERGSPSPEAMPLGVVADLDVHGDQLALLGAQRGEGGEWSPEGGVAFVGSLSKDLADLRPVTFSAAGPGSLHMARCFFLDTGAIRFLDDGRLVVVPGTEPGVSLYALDGKLLRTWSSDSLGFHDDCDFDEESKRSLAQDPAARHRWVQSRVLLDEVFDLNGAPALVLRHPSEDGTSWELVVLEENGTRRIPFPVTTESTKSHLRIDRLGDRLAVLIVEYGHLLGNAEADPQLLILRIEP